VSVLVGAGTRLLIQGLGREGAFHAARMIEYGTTVVGAAKPGKGGTVQDGLPLFDTVAQAVAATGANTSIIFVPAAGAPDAILEALDAKIGVVVAITEGIAVHEMLTVAAMLERSSSVLIGPNCPGLISPGTAKIGIMPAENFSKGPVGFVSRSGTLTYEIADLLTKSGLGQTTCIGIGGDPIIGLPTPDAVRYLNEDPETGRSAPAGKRMGHAGAIVSGNSGTAASKVAAFEAARIPVATAPSEIPGLVKKALAGR